METRIGNKQSHLQKKGERHDYILCSCLAENIRSLHSVVRQTGVGNVWNFPGPNRTVLSSLDDLSHPFSMALLVCRCHHWGWYPDLLHQLIFLLHRCIQSESISILPRFISSSDHIDYEQAGSATALGSLTFVRYIISGGAVMFTGELPSLFSSTRCEQAGELTSSLQQLQCMKV